MNILFAMSISGSIVFLLYLVTKPIASWHLTAHWQYNFLRICLLFYLIPYQCFQNKFLILYNVLFGNGAAVNPLKGDILVYEARNTIYITSDGRMHYKYWLPLLILSVIWLCSVTVLLYRQIKKYCSCRNNLLRLTGTSDAESFDIVKHCQNTIFSQRIKRPRIIICPFVKSPITIGLFNPVIVLPKQDNTENLSLYLSHELSHIGNRDALWKFIAFLTILVHWYNPLVYLLFYEIRVVCEKNCDEIVTNSLDETQKVHYGNLIIESALHQTDKGSLFADTFSTNKRITKERLLFLTRKKHTSPYRKIITALVICIAALSVPISVLAYHPVSVYRNTPSYELDQGIGDMYIIPDDTASPFESNPTLSQLGFTLSIEIITDDSDNQYTNSKKQSSFLLQNRDAAGSCSHEYVNARRTYHVPDGNRCTVYSHEGLYCRKCGFYLQESFVGEDMHTECPH